MKRFSILLSFFLFSWMPMSFSQTLSDSIYLYFEEIDSLEARIDFIKNRVDFIRNHVDFESFAEHAFVQKSESAEERVNHLAMQLSYGDSTGQARWVSHIIYPSIFDFVATRKDRFIQDPTLGEKTAMEKAYQALNKLSDQKKYDRGHLAPAADFTWSQEAMNQSFYYSNMSPQDQALNRARWKYMESLLRKYSAANQRPLFVCTGPIFDEEGRDPLDWNTIDIPSAFFKVAIDPSNQQGIAFVFPNRKIQENERLIDFVQTIDALEEQLELDFFSSLEDSLEDAVEAEVSIFNWMGTKDVGLIPFKYLPHLALNTDFSKFYRDEDLYHYFCGVVSQVRKNKKSFTVIIESEDPTRPLSILVPFSLAQQISQNFERDCVDGKMICLKTRLPFLQKNKKRRIRWEESDEWSFYDLLE